jgi:hypothetical protein
MTTRLKPVGLMTVRPGCRLSRAPSPPDDKITPEPSQPLPVVPLRLMEDWVLTTIDHADADPLRGTWVLGINPGGDGQSNLGLLTAETKRTQCSLWAISCVPPRPPRLIVHLTAEDAEVRRESCPKSKK